MFLDEFSRQEEEQTRAMQEQLLNETLLNEYDPPMMEIDESMMT